MTFSISSLFLKSVPVGPLTLKVSRDLVFAFVNGEYEEKNVVHWLARIFATVGDQATFYDIGANCGYFTLRFSSNAKQVYAFEPVRRTNDILSKNIRANGLTNATAFKVGLSDKDGEAVVQKYSSSGNNSLFRRSLPEGHPLHLIGSEKISIAKLDSFSIAHALRPPDIIKIDTEGAELFVLKGAGRLLTAHKPWICMEFAESTYNDAGYSTSEVLIFLQGLKYTIKGLSSDYDDMKLYSIAEFKETIISNIIAVPNGMELR